MYKGTPPIRQSIFEVSTRSPDELEHHPMASRTPFTLHFEETERGKTVFVGLAWQKERGILGQWSEYKSAIIPQMIWIKKY